MDNRAESPKVKSVTPKPPQGDKQRDVTLTVTVEKVPESTPLTGDATLWRKEKIFARGTFTVEAKQNLVFTVTTTRPWVAIPYTELRFSLDSNPKQFFNLGDVEGELSAAIKWESLTFLPKKVKDAQAPMLLEAQFDPPGELAEKVQICTEQGLGFLNEVEKDYEDEKDHYRQLDLVKAVYLPKDTSGKATLTFKPPDLPASGEAKDWKLQVDLCTPAPQEGGDPPQKRWTFQGVLPPDLPREPTPPKIYELRTSQDKQDNENRLVLVSDSRPDLPSSGVGFLRSAEPVDQRQFLGATVSYTQGKEGLRFGLKEVCGHAGFEVPGTVRKLEVTALDKQGREVRFSLNDGRIELCPPHSHRAVLWLRRYWFERLVLPVAGLGLLVLILLLYWAAKGRAGQETSGLRNDLRNLGSRVDEVAQSFTLKTGATAPSVTEQIEALRQSLEARIALLEESLKLPPGGPLDEGQGAPSYEGSPGAALQGPEQSLVSLVNGSWMGDGDARELAARQGLETFRSVDSSAAMRSITNRTFRFETARGGGSWVGSRQGSDLLLAPVHRRLFGTGDSLMFLSLLFDGLGSDLETIDFRRLVRPCRLRSAPGGSDRYTLIQKGRLETIASSSASPLPTLSSSAGRSPEPKELPASSERQVRKWVEEAMRSSTALAAPPPSPLARVDPEVPKLQGRLEVVEGTVAQLVKSVKSLEAPSFALLPAPSRALPPPPQVGLAPMPARPHIEEAFADLQRSEDDGTPRAAADSLLPVRGTTRPVTLSEAEILLGSLAPDWPMAKGTLFPLAPGGLPLSPVEYLRALVALRQAAQGLWRGPEWVVGLIHLSPQDSAASREPRIGVSVVREVAPDYESVLSGGRTIRDTLIYQLALGLSRSDRRAALVFPAAGLPIARFAPVYQALLGGEIPAGTPWVQSVKRPAALVPQGEEGFFTIAQTIQLEYGS